MSTFHALRALSMDRALHRCMRWNVRGAYFFFLAGGFLAGGFLAGGFLAGSFLAAF